MNPPYLRAYRLSLATVGVILALSVIPMPGRWARSALRSIRSPELNRADREAQATGYYVGLIDGGPEAARDELSLRLQGKSSEWKSFHEVGATKYLPRDLLQFELKPDLDRTVFGKPFTTNAQGLRDRPYTVEKPEGTFRIVLLGSSMDMGWGVATDETYENRLEDWLNAHAARRGISRKFEVINLAMAAYSPLHRLESFRRKAPAYRPDLVLYSATMLDTRLLEIHIRNLLQDRIDLRYAYLRKALAGAGIGTEDLRLDAFGELKDKDAMKAKIRPFLDDIAEATVGEIAGRCRADGTPMALLAIPRVGLADAPEARSAAILRLAGTARRLDLPFLDLTPTFDDRDPTTLWIAQGDDHPNDLGHKLLFEMLARDIVKNELMYRTIFGVEPPE